MRSYMGNVYSGFLHIQHTQLTFCQNSVTSFPVMFLPSPWASWQTRATVHESAYGHLAGHFSFWTKSNAWSSSHQVYFSPPGGAVTAWILCRNICKSKARFPLPPSDLVIKIGRDKAGLGLWLFRPCETWACMVCLNCCCAHSTLWLNGQRIPRDVDNV